MQSTPPIRTIERVNGHKSLIEVFRNVYDPGYLPYLSRIRYIPNPRSPDAPSESEARSCRSVSSEPLEAEDDPFEANIDADVIDIDAISVDENTAIRNEHSSTISDFSSARQLLKTGSEIESQNAWSEKDIENEENDEKEEWQGFQNQNSPSIIDIPPPLIESFESFESALQAVQTWASDHGYALRTRSSKRRDHEDAHSYRIYLECDRGGKNQPQLKADGKQLRKSSTRRRECPFRCMIGQSKRDKNASWTIQHSERLNNVHNHGPSCLPTANSIHRRNARKRKPEMLQQIQNNKLSRIPARDTLSSLRNQFPDAPLTLQDVKNVYDGIKRAMNRGLSAIQAMIAKLDDEYQLHYVQDDHERLERVLFFHNDSLQLLRLFPRSYVLDCTYQTNRFNSLLLDIVGFTATNSSFVIGQAFLTHEEEEDYAWVLQWIRDLYEEYGLPLPESITTDKADGLHRVCDRIWSEVPHLLCR